MADDGSKRRQLIPSKLRPDLDRLLREGVELVKRMTPAELDEMHRRQRESWARQDMD